MFSLTRIAERLGSSTEQVSGVSDVQTFVIGGERYVFVTSQSNGLITSYSLNAFGALTYIDQLEFLQAGTPDGLIIFEIDGTIVALPTGTSPTDFGAFEVSLTGHFSQNTTVLGDAAPHGNYLAATKLDINGGTYLYGSQSGESGLTGYKLDAGNTFIDHPAGSIDNDNQTFDVATTASAFVGGSLYLFAASQSDDLISSYWIRPNGVAKLQATVGSEQNLGIAVPNNLQIIVIAEQTFVLMASAGSSSITVLRVLNDGNMIVTDHVIDELTTRFQSTSVFETVQVGDRGFIVAGGGDDGLTLLELLPDGTLLHHDTIADQLNTSLGNVAGLTVFSDGAHLHVYAGGELDTGVTQFEIDLGALGDTIVGDTTANTLIGTSNSDVIYGGSSDDTLEGRGGDDILIDGAGQDTLIGGNGADVFVLSDDKQHDEILDFNINSDRLDLSNYELLRNIGQIEIISHVDGATLTFFNETLRIFTHDGQPLDADDLETMQPIQLSHMMIGLAPQNLVIEGSGQDDALIGGLGDDQLMGQDGNDVLAGGAGADWLEGGLGEDCADYSLAIQGVTVDLTDNSQNLGEADGDVLVSIEHIMGSDFKDTLVGDDLANEIMGSYGADLLKGARGADSLEGNRGSDKLIGQNGKDSLSGGKGSDVLKGGNGNDVLRGNNGSDRLFGSNGNDLLMGGKNNDRLTGGGGNDTLVGGDGEDTFVFKLGMDEITDFENNEDQLWIDSDLLASPDMSVTDVVETYGSYNSGTVTLDFGGSNILSIEGLNSLNHLNNDIEII